MKTGIDSLALGLSLIAMQVLVALSTILLASNGQAI